MGQATAPDTLPVAGRDWGKPGARAHSAAGEELAEQLGELRPLVWFEGGEGPVQKLGNPLLGVGDGLPLVMVAAFIPLAFTIGTDFRPAKRVDREQVLHWDKW
ncbi:MULTISPECIES: hypothetical protein [Nocardia]|uniref:hypothetical protein n=1 Tax=Nocardia TaxID=1817 RepID=UPI002454F523|nr:MULTISPECIES: hypothetical protein [Nocardia]